MREFRECKENQVTYLFIADLHLSQEHPRLIQSFLELLKAYQHKNTQLYILGDWFNIWIGDDYTAPWLDEIVLALKQFSQSGNRVYFQVGNRDFALSHVFLDKFNGKLLPDIYTLSIADRTFRLEHGDALCTDDISYQRFKRIIRNPLLLSILLKTPLNFRFKLANGFRKKSRAQTQDKPYSIMDVNPKTVEEALVDADILVHGHTHRPQIHDVNGKPRIVLGDWREKTSEAMILEVNNDGQWQFKKWDIA